MSPFLMPRLMASVAGCGLAIICVASTNQTATIESAPSAPRIVFDSTEYDLGTVTNAEFVTGSFTFQNKGNADLHIKILEIGGYSGILPTYQPVPPGQKGTISLRLNIGAAKGKITKHVKYGTDDPMNPVIPLTFTVNVSAGSDKK